MAIFNIDKVNNKYSSFYQEGLAQRHIKHDQIRPLIDALAKDERFLVRMVGNSVQGREVLMVSVGQGDTTVLAWTQMHGNESTATRAAFDFINLISSEEWKAESQDLLSKITFHVILMLNPDGAEIYQRENVWGLDLNRDAAAQAAPESRILVTVFREVKPQYCLNLHDQVANWGVGETKRPASLSFLAPPGEATSGWPKNRESAAKIIVDINNMIQNYMPGHVARYPDDYEPRAFGEFCQSQGAATILFEAGGYNKDWEREDVRKYYLLSMVQALDSIASRAYATNDIKAYESIPLNNKRIYNLIIRDVSYQGTTLSIGIVWEETTDHLDRGVYFTGRIDAIGDLSVFDAYEEIDGNGLVLSAGRIYPQELTDSSLELIRGQLQQGCIYFRYKDDSSENPVGVPIALGVPGKEWQLSLDAQPNFLLLKDDTVKYAIVNGAVAYPQSTDHHTINGIRVK